MATDQQHSRLLASALASIAVSHIEPRFHDHSLAYAARRHPYDEEIVRITNGIYEDGGRLADHDIDTLAADENRGDVASERVGVPRLCCLPAQILPLETYDDRELLDEWGRHLKADIQDFLREEGLEYSDVSIAAYGLKYRDWDNPNKTVIITATEATTSRMPNPCWMPICDQVYVKFLLVKYPTVHVEIRSSTAQLFIETKPLHCHDVIITQWPFVRSRCLARLHEYCDGEWLSFGCYRRRRLRDVELVTILISVIPKSGDLAPWRRLCDVFLEDLTSMGLRDVAVEIVAEDGSPEEYVWHTGCVSFAELGCEARMGRSLGVRHNYDRPFLTGTLGGFVTLSFDDDLPDLTCAMTCFHCVEDHRSSTEDRRKWLRDGITPGEAGDTIEVLQPAQVDVERWKEHLHKELSNFRVLAATDPARIIPHPSPNSLPTALQALNRTMHDVESELATVCRLTRPRDGAGGDDDLRLGTVFAASGKRVVPTPPGADDAGSLLDWALVEIVPTRAPRSRAASGIPLAAADGTGLPPPLPGLVQGYRRPLLGEPVFKLGRTSGLTRGVINPLPETVHHFRSAARGGSEAGEDERPDYADEVAVVAASGGHNAFSRRGDSGAWVVSVRGEYLGHVWAGKKRASASLIALATDTIEDIIRMTGATHVEVGVGEL